jgi:hypothetical protein
MQGDVAARYAEALAGHSVTHALLREFQHAQRSQLRRCAERHAARDVLQHGDVGHAVAAGPAHFLHEPNAIADRAS